MTPEEIVLLVNTSAAYLMFFVLIYRAVSEGKLKVRDPTGVNPLDYLFKPMPEHTYTFQQPFGLELIWCFLFLVVINLAWLLINVPELYNLATVYLLMASIPLIASLLEYSIPLKSKALAAMGFGWDRYDEQIIAGLAVAAPFVITNTLFTMKSQVMEELSAMPVASFIITVVVVPVVEEMTFRGTLAPTLAKARGLVPATIITSFVFAIFHAMAYEWTVPLLIYVFVFSLAATFVALYYKSILPSWIAHTLVNLSAMMFVIGKGFM